jgi:3',5'-cyclic AMP phosphodiesterase CpdA
MSLILQISDTHFGTERPAVVEALLELARAERPDLVVLSGDVTQRARRSQFAAAARFRDELATSARALVIVPGNHDIPLFDVAARVLHPYANYQRWFGSELEPSFASPELLVLGVNTTRWWRHKHGELSLSQIERVAERLRNATPQQLRVVVTHQPLQVTRSRDVNNLLRGYEHAVKTWSDAGADIFMGGHIHLPYVRRLGAGLPGFSRQTWVVQAGTAVSHRIREGVPNSINVIRSDGASCALERWDFDARTQRFACVTAEPLQLSRTPSSFAAVS